MCDYIIQIFEDYFSKEDNRFGYKVIGIGNKVVAQSMGYSEAGAISAAERAIKITENNSTLDDQRKVSDGYRCVHGYAILIVKPAGGGQEIEKIEIDIEKMNIEDIKAEMLGEDNMKATVTMRRIK